MKKRILSLTLVLCMILTLFPASVFAYGTTPEAGDPVCSDPIYSDPVYSDPVYTDPVTSDPATTDPTVVASGTCGENLTWVLDNSGTLTISGSGEMYDYNDSRAPWGENNNIKNVVIYGGVTSIGNRAFVFCAGLTSVTIPNSVTSIGNWAFECCGLTSVTIPDGVTSIGRCAFWNCISLSSVTIAASIISISSGVFTGCNNLSEIIVAENNEHYCSVDGVLFNKEKTELVKYPCSKPGEIYIVPDSVTSIEYAAFSNCSNLTNVTIPDSVTSIGSEAFYDCYGLTSITIPNSVTSIGSRAFSYCYNLCSVTIPQTVDYFGLGVFSGCDLLEAVDYEGTIEQWNAIETAITSKELYSFEIRCTDGTVKTSVRCGENATCTQSTTTLTISGTGAIYDYDDIYTDYEDKKYEGRSKPFPYTVQHIVIEEGITRIGECAFQRENDYGALTVSIPESVTEIGHCAFDGCNGITAVYFSASEDAWNNICIDGYSGLENATIHYNVSDIDSHYIATEVVEPTCTEDGYTVYTCPCGYSYEICAAATGHNFVDGECTECGMREGYACIGETRVDIPENEIVYLYFVPEESGYYNVTSICDEDTYGYLYDGKMNFIEENDDGGENNNFLISRYLEAGKIYCIGVRTYSGNASSADVCISKATTEGTCGAEGDNLTWTLDSNGTLTISGTGNMASYPYECNEEPWYSVKRLVKEVVVESGVTNIGSSSFLEYRNLERVTIEDGLTEIDNVAFSHCENLNCVTIPDSVTYIDTYAFIGCFNLTDVYYMGTSTQWKSISFGEGNQNLTDATIHFAYVEPAEGTCGAEGDNLTWTLDSDGTLTISGTGDMMNYDNASDTPWYDSREEIRNVVITEGVTNIGDWVFDSCYNLTSVTIPNSVTSIGDYAFTACSNLTSVDIPDSVTSIGVWAFFNCDSLTNVTIPDSVASISNEAFAWCNSLTEINVSENNEHYCSVDGVLFNKEKTELIQYPCGKSGESYTIPDSVTSIGYMAFSDCYNLTSVTIPDSVTSIGDMAFSDCYNLTSVTIPDSVTSIGDYAFFNCDSLTNVTIPDSVASIGNKAFAWCNSLTEINVSENNEYYCSADGVLFNKEKTELIQYPCGKSGESYTIPDSVTSIGDYAFSGCNNLTSVIIPDSVTTIGDLAFCECHSLTSVTFHDSVTSIGYGVFQDCYNLADAYYSGSEEEWNAINIGEENDCLTNAAIHYNVSDIDGHYIATEVVEPTCTEDGYTVYACPCGYSYEIYIAALGHNFVDGECTECGMREGYACIGKTMVDIPENETVYLCFIPEENGLYSFTTLSDEDTYGYLYDAEKHVIADDDDSGDGYNFLIRSYLEASETYYIGVRTYNGNESSVDVYISKANTEIIAEGTCGAEGDNLTWTLDSNGTLTISGTGDMMNYDDAYYVPWGGYCEGISNVIITEGVTSIGDWAFYDFNNLMNVTIPDNVTSIGDDAFWGCSNLTNVAIHDSVTSIGLAAFNECTNLSEINVSENNEYYCSVDGVLFNKEKTEIIQYPCGKSGESYTIPDSVTAIGDYAFAYSSSNLTTVTIPDGVTSIGDSAFAYCNRLTSVDIPDGVISIGDYMFDCCPNLTSVYIPDSVTSIGNYAFSGCNNLADVYYSGSEEEWNAINIGEENDCLTNATIHFADEPICDHNYTATVTAPNCTEQGYTTYTCDNCGDSYVADYVEAIGHNFVNGKCTECGATAPVAREGFIVVSDERARAGEEVTVSVSVEENPGIMVMVLGFDYDKSKLELIGYEDGLMSGWKVASNAVWIGGDSVYEDGVILKLKFKVLDDVEDGEVKVSVLFAEGDIANHDEQIIMPEELDGSITVYTNIPGDINGDDIVNALDLVRLQRYITGEAVAVAASCDVTGDGLINAQDLVRLQRYLSGENIVIY